MWRRSHGHKHGGETRCNQEKPSVTFPVPHIARFCDRELFRNGNVFGGYGADHWVPVRTIVISLASSDIALVVLPLAAISVLGAAAALIVWGSAAWMFTAPQQHRLLALAPESLAVILCDIDGCVPFSPVEKLSSLM
jgi:hypothetical protein